MPITYEQIAILNKDLPRLDIKGKQYSAVASRIQAFRKLIPGGSITTDIVSLDDTRVVMKSTVSDETGRVLATGLAFEDRGSSFINKTSFIENCETSAVGRALGMIGIGSDESMASAEELVNALNNQGKRDDPKTRAEIMKIINDRPAMELTKKICSRYKVRSINDLTPEDAEKCLRDLRKTVKE